MQHAAWQAEILQELSTLSEEGRQAAEWLRAGKTQIGFARAGRSVAAFWTPLRNIRLNSRLYSRSSTHGDAYLLSILIHEAVHLRQGLIGALSIRGELEAWGLQFQVLRRLGKYRRHPALDELMETPLGWDRAALSHARKLMRQYAGRGYRADLLPLYPVGWELWYWIGRLLRSPLRTGE